MDDAWVSFDCYGTLIDWRSGMARALESVAPGQSALLIETYHRLEPGLEAMDPFISYREVLSIGLRAAASKAGVVLPDDAGDALVRSLAEWPLYDDTLATLEELRERGWKVAILSNVDTDLIEGTLRGTLAFEFDDIVTAEQVRAYKPSMGMFEELQRRQSPRVWVHAGCSVWHDVRPIHRLGHPGVLVDRAGAQAREAAEADVTLDRLYTLPEALRRLA